MTSAPQFVITGLERAPRRQEFPCLGKDAFAESVPVAGSVWFLKRILRNRLYDHYKTFAGTRPARFGMERFICLRL
jgi:hypothetical protein